MADRFYVPGIYTAGQRRLLNAERSNYLCRVLRLANGDAVEIFDGFGNVFACEITASNPRQAELEVVAQTSKATELRLSLGVAIGLIKGQPMDRAIAQATELGATDIYLIDGQRSNVKLNDHRLLGKLEHWQKVIIASCEQCGQITLPILHKPARLAPMLSELAASGAHLLFFDPKGDPAPNALPALNRVVFIGPEGGFGPEELNAFTQHNVDGYRLGPLTLRAETMPAAALTLIQHATGWPAYGSD